MPSIAKAFNNAILCCPCCYHGVSFSEAYHNAAYPCPICGVHYYFEFIRTTPLRAGIALANSRRVNELIERARGNNG